MAYQRVLLKLSGEVLKGDQESGIDFKHLHEVAKRLVDFKQKNKVQLGIVVGAGNIWRYRDSDGSGIERTEADKMGMLASVMNGVALASAIRQAGQAASCLSGFSVPDLVPDYDIEDARERIEDDEVLLLAGGTTNPYFTTDSAAVLRALELNCDLLLKGTQVDGVYDHDPHKNPEAKRYDELDYQTAIEKGLRVMDLTAIALARDNNLKMVVFEFADQEALNNILTDHKLGTLVQ